MEDPNFTNMSPDYNKSYRYMIKKKKDKDKDKEESAIDRITRILYGGSNK